MSQKFYINLIPFWVILGSLAVGLNNGLLWSFTVLIPFFICSIFYPTHFIRSFGRLFVTLLTLTFAFLYSTIRSIGQDFTTSPANILLIALVLVTLETIVSVKGIGYLLDGFKQLNVALVFSAIIGIYETLTHYNPLIEVFEYILSAWKMGSPDYRATGIFSHPVPFAHFIIAGIVITVFTVKNKIVKLVIVLTYLFALIGTQTRSAWLVLLLWIVVGIIIVAKRTTIVRLATRLLVFSPIIIAVAALALSSSFMSDYTSGAISRFTNFGLNDVSFVQRVGALQLIFEEFLYKSSPLDIILGSGISSSNQVISSTNIAVENFNTVDNYFAAFIYDFGVLYFLLLILIICFTFVAATCGSRAENPSSIRSLYFICFSLILISVAFMGLYSFTIWRGIQIVLLVSIYTSWKLHRLSIEDTSTRCAAPNKLGESLNE